MPGVEVKDISSAVIVSLLLVLLNVFLKPILVFLTLPITVFTLGFFLLVINASMVLIASHLLPEGFMVDGFWVAFLFSIILSIVTAMLEFIAGERDRREN